MKAILADNDVEEILAALVSNRRMPPPAAPRAHRSEHLAVLELRPRVLIKQTPGGWFRFPSELFGWAIPWVENAVDGGFHMRSTTSIPSNSRPNFKVCAVRSQIARRLSRRAGDSALRTGHSSKKVLNALARSNK